MRVRIASLFVLVGLIAAVPSTAQAAPEAQAAANSGGISSTDKPPPPPATGGSQAGRAPARQTRLVLARAARNLGRRSLRRGVRGAEVKTLQLVLTALGYRAKATGFFSQGTEYQVKRFQRTWHIDVIGVVGPATGAALRSALQGGKPPPAPVVPPRSTSAPPHAGEPPIEDVEVTDLLLVVDRTDEVLVVDEHPRYHLPGCPFLDGRDGIGLPIVEARTDGFTPCAACRPVRHLADTERSRRQAAGGP